jgi:actin-related protein
VIPVIDLGAGYIKAGYSGQMKPEWIIPNVMGELNFNARGEKVESDKERFYC